MKKLLIIPLLFILMSAKAPTNEVTPYDIIEAVNTLEDMIEWMEWDIKTNKVDKAVGEMYMKNMQELVDKLSPPDSY